MPDEEFQRLQDAASRGDATALDQLLATFLPRLHAFVRTNMGERLRSREASIDIVQSVCRETLEERGRFEFRGEGQFLSWLLTSAMNKLRQRSRNLGRQRRDAAREEPMSDGASYQGLSPSGEVMSKEQIDRLDAALQTLPDDYREIVTLAKLVGMSHADIAEHLGRSLPSVRNALGRALRKLGEALERGAGAPDVDGRWVDQ